MKIDFSKSCIKTLPRFAGLLLAGGLLGGVINLLHPHGIAWVQDWESYVEAKAIKQHLEVIPVSMAYSLHQDGLHLFIDARSEDEYVLGHIPGAISLPFERLYEQLDALEEVLMSNEEVVVYCRNRECDDALLLCLQLREMGKTNLLYFVDGFMLWEEMECPVEIN